jgi:hypothetical protein
LRLYYFGLLTVGTTTIGVTPVDTAEAGSTRLE